MSVEGFLFLPTLSSLILIYLLMKNLVLLLFCWLSSFHTSLFAQWQPTDGPFGGNVNSLNSNANYLFASTCNGVFRSADKGQNWEKASQGLPQESFCANYLIVLGDTLLTMTLAYEQNNVKFHLFRSDNHGDSWVGINLPSPQIYLLRLYGNSNVIILDSDQGTLMTKNNGATWAPAQNPARLLAAFGSKDAENSPFYVTVGNKIYVSDENAENWTTLCEVNVAEPPYIDHLFIEDSLIMVHFYPGKTYRSTDLGSSWELITSHDYVCSYLRLDGSLYGLNGYSGEILKSDNNGKDWYPPLNSSIPLKFDGVHAIGQSLLFNSIYGLGVYRSDDNGQSVFSANRDLVASNSHLKIYEDTLYAIGLFHLFKSSAQDIHWDTISHFTSSTIGSGSNFFKVKNGLFEFVGQNKLLRSMNYGASWEQLIINTAIPVNTAIGGEEDIFLKSGNYGDTLLYQSSDLGNTWTEIGTNITAQIGAPIQDIYVFQGDWYIAAENGFYRSTNKGLNWIDESQGLFPLPNGQKTWNAQFYSSADYLVIVTKSTTPLGGFNTTNYWIRHKDSLEWKEPNSGLPYYDDQSIDFLELSFAQAGNILLMSYGYQGIFGSTDGGETWQQQIDGLPGYYAVYGYLSITSTSQNVFLSVRDQGVWQRSVADFTLASKDLDQPSSIQMVIAPNPNSGNFELQLPEVVLQFQVFDHLGKLRFSSSQLPDRSIHLQGLENGVYYILARTPSGLVSQRFILQR